MLVAGVMLLRRDDDVMVVVVSVPSVPSPAVERWVRCGCWLLREILSPMQASEPGCVG